MCHRRLSLNSLGVSGERGGQGLVGVSCWDAWSRSGLAGGDVPSPVAAMGWVVRPPRTVTSIDFPGSLGWLTAAIGADELPDPAVGG